MIGVFDSGFGGLTILKSFLKELPEYNYIYLGDNARAPYGDKSQELIYSYTIEAVDFLFKKGADLIIIACNTASAKALRIIQQVWLPKNYPQKRVLGVIIPIVEEVINDNENIGIIGTRATIESKTYNNEIKKFNFRAKIIESASPLLVPLIEEGWHKKKETKMILRKYLKLFKEKKVNKLILGCTHYPILQKEIERIMGKSCSVLNSPEIVAQKLADYLIRHKEMEKKLQKKKQRIFFTTDDPVKFKKLGQKFLGQIILKVKKIELK